MDMLDDLKFPVIKGKMSPPSLRPIDEIIDWINRDYNLCFNRDLYNQEKRLHSVNIPFTLKD